MKFLELPAHAHCMECNRVLPPYQKICMKCVAEALVDEGKPREPYYKEFVEEVK